MGECVGGRIDLFSDVMNDEVVILELGMPPCSSVVEFLWVLPECEVGMICQYNELVLSPCEV